MTIDIHKGEVLTLEKSGTSWELRTLEGRAWLTQPCDANDYVLSPGTPFRMKRGRVVIEALTARVKIELSAS